MEIVISDCVAITFSISFILDVISFSLCSFEITTQCVYIAGELRTSRGNEQQKQHLNKINPLPYFIYICK